MKTVMKCTIKKIDIRLVDWNYPMFPGTNFIVLLCHPHESNEQAYQKCLKRIEENKLQYAQTMPSCLDRKKAERRFFKIVKAANLKQIEFHEC